ncbi:variant sh3 domain containing protein [Anaeramoeba ignava]|uniref:Variant sh3 domain containing protein n=1 Tax=Anaeramoeba ignava TaxID=1746090 RepID=A0A9Q0LK22_ANAIG|nr:variant sh3 domain containing protein [Anaeramoeba ignava]
MSDILIEGYLELQIIKQNEISLKQSHWKKHYFVLTKQTLRYFVKKNKNLKGEIKMKTCEISFQPNEKFSVITIISDESKSPIFIKFDSESLMDEWIKEIVKIKKLPNLREVKERIAKSNPYLEPLIVGRVKLMKVFTMQYSHSNQNFYLVLIQDTQQQHQFFLDFYPNQKMEKFPDKRIELSNIKKISFFQLLDKTPGILTETNNFGDFVILFQNEPQTQKWITIIEQKMDQQKQFLKAAKRTIQPLFVAESPQIDMKENAHKFKKPARYTTIIPQPPIDPPQLTEEETQKIHEHFQYLVDKNLLFSLQIREAFENILQQMNTNENTNMTIEEIMWDEYKYLLELKRYISKGISLEKIQRNAKFKPKKFWVSSEGKSLCWSHLNLLKKKVKKIDMFSIESISEELDHTSSKKFSKLKKFELNLFFSIQSKEKTIYFMFNSLEEKRFWFPCLFALWKNYLEKRESFDFLL